jgi:hypothetical protein
MPRVSVSLLFDSYSIRRDRYDGELVHHAPLDVRSVLLNYHRRRNRVKLTLIERRMMTATDGSCVDK